MRKIIFISTVISCMFCAMLLQAATVYKKVNKDGSVEYSDKPFSGAKKVVLKDMDSQSTLPRYTPPRSTSTKSKNTPRNQDAKISITSPINGDTIRNNEGNITVLVQKQGKKSKSYKTQILVNGTAVGKPTQASVISLKNIDRGELKIKAQLISSSGKILASTKETVVYLHRVSVIRSK